MPSWSEKLTRRFKAPDAKDTVQGGSAKTATPVIAGGAIRLPDITIGGKTPRQLEEVLAEGAYRSQFEVSDDAKDLLRSRDFTTLADQRILRLVRIEVSALDLGDYPTIEQVYAKAEALGLDLCPAETGPYLLPVYRDQKLKEWLYLGMKPIAASGGGSRVFGLELRGIYAKLTSASALPGAERNQNDQFVFSLRP